MPIDYNDPLLLAQMALTQMVQRSKAGKVFAKSGLAIENNEIALKTVDVLNLALGSVPDCCFQVDNYDGHIFYDGIHSLHIPGLLIQVKGEGIYKKSTGAAVSVEEIINNIKLIDLNNSIKDQSTNDNSTNDNAKDLINANNTIKKVR